MAAEPARVAIVGTGNIGTDLMEKILRSDGLELAMFAGIDPNSAGIARAIEHGVDVSTEGIDGVLAMTRPVDFVFEATSASVHRANAGRYADAGLKVIDLTPAKLGPSVVPALGMPDLEAVPNVNMITCGGQATVPMVGAVSSVTPVHYAEIVSAISSLSAGPGTRQNIDEFTVTTAGALESVGGAESGKAIIILNPADPPVLMRNTVHCTIDPSADHDLIEAAVHKMAATVQGYVPGYRLVAGPEFDERGETVSIFLEVTGSADFLPDYAGNLDIMTAAAVAVGEQLAVFAQSAGGHA
ncbi:MAG TPA: acetaldehyde dehydrogenase (acetylating) [Solirubrobacterales bacterium]|nr:acetaldehyde dehydrogenase (acetylating) [Solirubrobacterales bacterium]